MSNPTYGSSNPMPGWYPDPEAPERQRFWDGTKWTEARAYPAVNPNDPQAAAAPAGVVPDEKRKSNPWIVIALIAVIAAVIFGLAWFFLLRDSGTSTTELAPLPKGTPPATAPAAPTAVPTAVPTR
jgi:hypothetical protein